MGVGRFIVPVKDPVLGEKEITSNGTYTASSEGLDGYSTVTVSVEGGSAPSTSSQSIFTGATIPLTYKDNIHATENIYVYKSPTHNITIAGLEGRATITGNGTKEVTASFDVTSAVSSLKNFTITCVKGTESVVYTGMHAHYGITCTGILTFAYKNIMKDGSEGTIGTNYLFIETASNTLHVFSSNSTLRNGIYSYQLLNVLIGNYASTSISDYFLGYCYSFNQPLDLSNITSIGDSFLYSCRSFNQPIDLSGVSSIGSNFLVQCYAFNQPLDLSDIASIGSAFLNGCISFNQPLDLSNITSIGDSFLSDCRSFNQPLDLSDITSIGIGFLYGCSSFNQPLDLSDIASISDYFLGYCYSFNQPLDLSNITSIDNDFLYNCYSFNQPLDLSDIASIGDSFLGYCYSFNQSLDLSNITSIGIGFLYNCSSFNQPLDLSNIASIGDNFLRNCYSFNHPLIIPAEVTSLSTYFASNCYSLSTIVWNSTTVPSDAGSLSQDTASKPHTTNGAGIVVYGTQRETLMTALPNRLTSGSAPYRKLVNGGS